MERNRREFLKGGMATALGSMAASGAQENKSQEKTATARLAAAARRPVLYNGDEDYYYYRGPERMDRAYLEGIVNRLADAKVTIFSNTFYAAGRCWYDTKVGVRFDKDPYYDYTPATGAYGDLFSWKEARNVQQLIEEGNDPIRVFTDTCHKRGLKFLACLRMNDRHGVYTEHPPQLIRQNPDMVLKDKKGHPMGGMDFQFPEVRDHAFKPMEEMVADYDVDGLELDWMRWCKMFSEDVPQEKRTSILTDYHRRIRQMLDEVGKRKGKRLLLSVRVPTTLAECEPLGYDVPTHIREGLIDILCPSDFLFCDPHMPVGDFARHTRGTKVKLLPSLHASAGWAAGYATTENLRAFAHSYYEQGADGISLYNYYTKCERSLPENYRAMEEAGDPAALATRPREYIFTPIWGGRTSQTGRMIDCKAVVLRSSPGKREVFPFLIKEDLAKVRLSLKFRIENLTAQDEIRLDINGKPLDQAQFKTSYSSWGKLEDMRNFDESWSSGPYYLFELGVATHLLKDGTNEIGITLARANPVLPGAITLFQVQVGVKPV